MWVCPTCGFSNDDVSGDCGRCGLTRPHEQPRLDAAASRQAELDAQRARRSPGRGMLEAAAIVILVVSLVGLAVVGYIAWSRGLLPGVAAGDGPGVQPQPGLAGQAEADTLAALERAHGPGLKALRKYIEPLRAARRLMSGQQITAGQDGAFSPDSLRLLGALNTAGPDLIAKYGEFEDLVLQQNNPKLAKYQGIVRDEFSARFNELVDLLAQAYAKDEQGKAADYAMVDTLQTALAKYSQIDSTPYKDRWARAVHSQSQLPLDRANKDVYLQLEARYEALLEVHNRFNEIAKTIPSYTIHGGILPDAAVKVLDAYDALAAAIEKLTAEFAGYTATLSPDLDSDRRKELVAKFEKLAQEDHFLCFEGVYKVYAQDRELENPAYENLKQHYEFVRQYWPAEEGKYIATYTRYEDQWASRWKGAG